jgi:hypothetical protein
MRLHILTCHACFSILVGGAVACWLRIVEFGSLANYIVLWYFSIEGLRDFWLLIDAGEKRVIVFVCDKCTGCISNRKNVSKTTFVNRIPVLLLGHHPHPPLTYPDTAV